MDEPFTNATTATANWVLPTPSGNATNDACLTESTDTSQHPIPGCSAPEAESGLQLTTNAGGQEGGVVYGSSVPTAQGLDVTFSTYQYGHPAGSGADGISFFLAASDPTNATASPVTLGPNGGDLGYIANGSTPGLTHGYVGVGLDVYGNFSNPAFSGSECGETPDAPVSQSVTIRGPGEGTTGYCILTTSHLPNGTTLDSSNPSAVDTEVALNPTNAPVAVQHGTVDPGELFVWVQPLNGDAVSEEYPLPDDAALPGDWVDANGRPHQLTFGWSASTGSVLDAHTISNVRVTSFLPPPTYALGLGHSGTTQSGHVVTFTASPSLNTADDPDPATLTDTFPAGLTPQTPSGTGWDCSASSGQTVSCTHPASNQGSISPVSMPVLVSVPAGPPQLLSDTATIGSPDGVQISATDSATFSPAPTATALGFLTQPVNAKVNTAMQNADTSQRHIQVAAQVTPGGATDTTYTGPITLSLTATDNHTGANFVSGDPPSLTVNAVNGVADFSPVAIDTVGFGYTLSATASGLTSATSNAFDVNGTTTTCPSGQSCTVTTTSPTTGDTANIQGQPGPGPAVITASYGGNVAPIHPCTGTSAGILTFSGDRPKIITITIPARKATVRFCFGQPTPFLDITYRPTTFFNPVNQDFEGLLPVCLRNFTGPCIKSIALKKATETVVIQTGAADPHLMH